MNKIVMLDINFDYGNEIQTINPVLLISKNDVVLVVGHEPFLGHWAKEITGTPIDFKTGSIAIFEYDPAGHGKLLLYVQPKAATLIL